MTILKNLAAALATVVLATGTAQAGTMLNEWVFNPVGQGFDSGQLVNEYLDTNGTSFFQIERTGGTSVAFREHRTMTIVQADANGRLFPVNYPGA
jgi:hypothetical protein